MARLSLPPDVQEIGFNVVAPTPFLPESCGQDSPSYVGGSLSIPPKPRLLGWAALGAATGHSVLRRGPRAKDQLLVGRSEGGTEGPPLSPTIKS